MIKVEIARFDIEATLGTGGMGVVYRALDRESQELRALKLLRPEVLAERGLRSRFLREARAASALDHPAIARVHDVGEVSLDADTLLALGLIPQSGIDRIRLPYISMELVSGTGLHSMIEEGFEVEEVLNLMEQILAALEAAHAIGVVHRDLKPENIVVTPEGRAKLLDFGLAKILPGADSELGTGSQLTLDGMVMGTLPYLAPEQLQADSVRRRSDLFSLGVLAYEMLTGTTPFPGNTMVEYARAILTRKAEPPSRLRPEIPLWLDDLVLSLLEIEPEDRPVAAEVRRTLESHRSGGEAAPDRTDTPEGTATLDPDPTPVAWPATGTGHDLARDPATSPGKNFVDHDNSTSATPVAALMTLRWWMLGVGLVAMAVLLLYLAGTG